jgi:transcriptional regulator with XRE-family HTH domain
VDVSKAIDALDPVRERIVTLAAHRGLSLKQLSLKIGRNHAYLQQFVRRGTPRTLPEKTRLELAAILGVPDSDLMASKARDQRITATVWRDFSYSGLMFFAMPPGLGSLEFTRPNAGPVRQIDRHCA